ncbi:hypothetical protein [Sorangium cellulosum]|uniref:hypothetical protein n=1 Tax=Sorangium cellulosum TaxID=56 RepID=UPI0013319071|nr:hypothetical protein [Sorangium cellulosum]
MLRGLPTVVGQDVAEGSREAIDRASHIAERSVRRAIGRSRPAAAALRHRRWSTSPEARGLHAARRSTEVTGFPLSGTTRKGAPSRLPGA